MRIWIISLFEPTPVDNTRPMRYMGIADAAIRNGHQVIHFACSFRHSTKVQRFHAHHTEQVSQQYKVVFVHSPAYAKNVSYSRLKSHKVFTDRLLQMIPQFEKPDVVLVALPPLVTAEAITKWGKDNGVPVYIDIIDPWPEVVSILFPKLLKPVFKIVLQPMYRQLYRILKNCTGVIAISDEYIRWAKSFNYPIRRSAAFLPSIPMDEVQQKIQAFLARHPRPSDGVVRCIYAGNLGVAYDIPTILKAAATLHEHHPGKTIFTIAGSGHYETMIQDYMRRYPNIIFLGRIGYDELMEQYAHSDLGLAQYGKGATQSVTYKFFDYLGAGLPILNSLMTEMAVLTDRHQVGFNNQPGDDGVLAENIKKFIDNPVLLETCKRNALDYASEHGNNDTVYNKLINFITTR